MIKLWVIKIEDDVHDLLVGKCKELRMENGIDLPLGIMAGEIIRRHIKEEKINICLRKQIN